MTKATEKIGGKLGTWNNWAWGDATADGHEIRVSVIAGDLDLSLGPLWS